MNPGYKHHTRWTFGNIVWHRVTKDKGMIVGINLRHSAPASYSVVFEDSRADCVCLELELTDEPEFVTTPA